MQFLLSLKEMMKMHKLEVVAILEPRIYGPTMDIICKKLAMRDWFRVEATGFSGEYGYYGTKKRWEYESSTHRNNLFTYIFRRFLEM